MSSLQFFSDTVWPSKDSAGAKFVNVFRSDRLVWKNKVCGNAVEILAVPTIILGMLTVMP